MTGDAWIKIPHGVHFGQKLRSHDVWAQVE